MDEDEMDFLPVPEEVPPENLRKKWEKEEFAGKETVQCRHCGKWVPKENMTCLYCREKIFYESGPLGRMAQLLAEGKLLWIRLALVIILGLVMMRF